jgi:GMC oxidoreductase
MTRRSLAPWGIHEVSTTRMGDDPKNSVLNSHCQAWDCKNLFIADTPPFVSNADKNPPLTILALAWRTSEYAAEHVKKRNTWSSVVSCHSSGSPGYKLTTDNFFKSSIYNRQFPIHPLGCFKR